MKDEKNPIQVADRLFHIMELLSARGPMQLMDIASEEGLNKTTTYRVLRSLMYLGYVRQNEKDGRYSMTFRIVGIADQVAAGFDIIGEVHPYLEALSKELHETVHMVMWDPSQGEDTQAVYVDKVEDRTSSVRMVSHIGGRISLYSSGVGKAILADMEDENIREIWDRSGVHPVTSHTITKWEDFLKTIGQIRKDGYALDNEENEEGVRCVAVSLPDVSRHIRYAVSISAPIIRMDDARVSEIAGRMLKLKTQLKKDLNGA